MSSQAIGAIDAVQPYREGNDALWRLHKLSIVDKHRLILIAGSAVRSVDLGKYITQMAPKDSPLSLANLSVFLKPRDNDYPLEVGTVVFSDLTTSKVVELTLKLELVLYERDIVEGESLLDTQQGMISAVEELYLDPSPGAPAGLIFGTAAFADQTLQPKFASPVQKLWDFLCE
jgi:hypothetical protein